MANGEDFIPEHTRARLTALGVPTAKQVHEVLSGLFPRELNIGSAKLTTQDLAKVLVDLAARGIISVSGTAVASSVRKVVPGWHFCQFYKDFDELLTLVAPYVAEGLRNDEGCFWVMPAAVSPESARAALLKVIPNVDDYLASGQLEMAPHSDWYLDESGQLKTFERVAEALLGKQDNALSKGFKFLRAAGDCGWACGTPQTKEFIDYEMKINAAIGSTKVAAICTYRPEVSADELVGIVTAHQDALFSSPAASVQ